MIAGIELTNEDSVYLHIEKDNLSIHIEFDDEVCTLSVFDDEGIVLNKSGTVYEIFMELRRYKT